MKILHGERQIGKTNDIFWLAFENQPSVILVVNKHKKDYLEKYMKDVFEDDYERQDVKIELFTKYDSTGQHNRNIFIDDLDLCLQYILKQDVKIASITDQICDRALKDSDRMLKEKDGKIVCQGYIYGMNESVCRNCEACSYQYGHPFDPFWNKN